MHPQYLRVAGGVGAEGALVAEEVLPIQVDGQVGSAALSPDTQVNWGGTWVEVGRRGGGVVQPLQEGFLQLGVATRGHPVQAGSGTRTGSVRGSRVSDTDMGGVGLQISRDKVTEAANVRFLICKKRKLQDKGQQLQWNYPLCH